MGQRMPANGITQNYEQGNWSTEFSVPGVIGTVYATASDKSNLYLGGNFRAAGSIIANSIVRWDGDNWYSIGEDEENGIPANTETGMPTVLAMAHADGKLFVGGQFSRAGTVDVNGIACWDGERWQKLGKGDANGLRSIVVLENDTIIQPGLVYSLFVHKDKLYVGGFFQLAGDSSTNGLAVWDIKKQRWETMNGGFTTTEETPAVYGYSFAEFNNKIFVAGKFNIAEDTAIRNIAAWDGKGWQSVGEVKSDIFDIQSDNKGNIYAVGYYHENDTSGLCGLGIWDGYRWKAIKGPDGYKCIVSKIKIIKERVFVTGSFERDDGSVASLAKWDGKEWQVIHGPGYTHDNQLPAVIRGIEYIKDKYYVAGDFTKVNDTYVVNVAEWNDSEKSWKSLDDDTGNKGIYDGSILRLEKDGDAVYAGGSFNVAGGKLARNIARWKGHEWESLGKDEENGIEGSVFAILTSGRNVFAGGYFGKAGSSEAFHVAQWDGEKWRSLGIGVGGIEDAHVRDLAMVGNYLYVAGYFKAVGDEHNYELKANSIARFSLNSRRWEALGKGVEYDEGIPGRINDIEVSGGKILIGGEFNRADGVSAKNYAVLDENGFSESGSASGIEGLVNAIKIINNQVYIAGLINFNETEKCGILKWDNNEWTELNAGHLSADTGELFVTDIEPFRDGFIAGGYFTHAGNQVLNNLAYFDGNEWVDIGGGLQTSVSDLEVIDNKLFLTGPSVVTSGQSVISSGETNGIGLAEFEFDEETIAAAKLSSNESVPESYPNPFQTTTLITYTLESPGQVDVSVLDPAGKPITYLVSGHREAGIHTTLFDGSGLEPGVYLCRISHGPSSRTIKLVITRK